MAKKGWLNGSFWINCNIILFNYLDQEFIQDEIGFLFNLIIIDSKRKGSRVIE